VSSIAIDGSRENSTGVFQEFKTARATSLTITNTDKYGQVFVYDFGN
jgi:hypothetical protein